MQGQEKKQNWLDRRANGEKKETGRCNAHIPYFHLFENVGGRRGGLDIKVECGAHMYTLRCVRILSLGKKREKNRAGRRIGVGKGKVWVVNKQATITTLNAKYTTAAVAADATIVTMMNATCTHNPSLSFSLWPYRSLARSLRLTSLTSSNNCSST